MKDPLKTAFVQPAGGAEEPAPAAMPRPVAGAAPSSGVALALARLQASRQALRLHLMPPVEPQDSADAPGAGGSLSLNRMWRKLRRWTRSFAPVSVLADAVEQTWRLHPLRPVGEAIAAGYRSQVAPTLRRHPWAVVAVAAAVGAALVFGRRWHAPLLANTLRPLPQRLGRWLLRQLASAPVQTALAGWLMVRAAKSTPEPEPAPVPAADGADRASIDALIAADLAHGRAP